MRALPLAARMRPRELSEFVGQKHFLGEGKLLYRLLKADRLGSTIFYGPPGSGKTTLAYLLAKESRAVFRQLSAVSDGVKALREIRLASCSSVLVKNSLGNCLVDFLCSKTNCLLLVICVGVDRVERLLDGGSESGLVGLVAGCLRSDNLYALFS